MANLKADLDSYLTRGGNSGGGASSLSTLAKSLKLPTLSKNDDTRILVDDGADATSPSCGSGICSKIESSLPAFSRKQRLYGFLGLLSLGIFCFVLSFIYVPVLLLQSRKFAILFSFGSLFTFFSVSFINGPLAHFKHLISKERIPFSIAYLGTLIATLYFALGLKSVILTIIFAIAQIIALIWFVVSYVPGGSAGLMYMTKMCSSICTRG